MLTALLLDLALLPQAGLHQIQKCGPVQVAGVVWSERTGYLESWVRSRGTLPEGGVWSLKILRITHLDGSRLAGRGPLFYGQTDGRSAMAGIELTEQMPQEAKVVGELVHYQTVEESVTFPVVNLELSPRWPTHPSEAAGQPHLPAGRTWELPSGPLASAKTPRGLGLSFFSLPMGGYSGPGYDDLSRFPVRVQHPTLSAGLSQELRKLHAGAEERVDASTRSDWFQTVYQKDPPIDGTVFTFRDKDFKPTVSLTLRVRRMFPDKRYPFSLVLPVQVGKSPYEASKANPDPAKKVRWP